MDSHISDTPDDRVLQELGVIMSGMVEGVVKPATLFSAHGAVNDQRGSCRKVTQFQKVCGDLEVPVELLNLSL